MNPAQPVCSSAVLLTGGNVAELVGRMKKTTPTIELCNCLKVRLIKRQILLRSWFKVTAGYDVISSFLFIKIKIRDTNTVHILHTMHVSKSYFKPIFSRDFKVLKPLLMFNHNDFIFIFIFSHMVTESLLIVLFSK